MYVKCHSMFHPCCFRYGARSPLVSTGPLPIPPRVERERVCFVWLCVGGPSRVNRFIGHRATENSQLHCSSVDDDNSLVATPNAMMSNLPNPLSLRSVYKWDAERIRLHTCRCNSMLKSCQPIRVYKYVLCGGTGGERTTEYKKKLECRHHNTLDRNLRIPLIRKQMLSCCVVYLCECVLRS